MLNVVKLTQLTPQHLHHVANCRVQEIKGTAEEEMLRAMQEGNSQEES